MPRLENNFFQKRQQIYFAVHQLGYLLFSFTWLVNAKKLPLRISNPERQ